VQAHDGFRVDPGVQRQRPQKRLLRDEVELVRVGVRGGGGDAEERLGHRQRRREDGRLHAQPQHGPLRDQSPQRHADRQQPDQLAHGGEFPVVVAFGHEAGGVETKADGTKRKFIGATWIGQRAKDEYWNRHQWALPLWVEVKSAVGV
jgi:hypothetical protein